MTDPELQAAMQVFSLLTSPAYLTDFCLYCLQLCRMVKLSLQHGTSGASAVAFGFWGHVLSRVFRRYDEGYRFAKLACDLVEQHGFIGSQARAYLSMATVAIWTQPITTAIDFSRMAFHAVSPIGEVRQSSISSSALILMDYNWHGDCHYKGRM